MTNNSITNSKELWKSCFFCGEKLDGRETMEHIIPNSLLGKLQIREQFLNGVIKQQYSRLKVPAHKHCNSTFGSQYENTILDLIDDPEKIYESISNDDGLALQFGPDNTDLAILKTWMTKIYYGIFYNDFLKTTDENYQKICKDIISSPNFKLTQESYRNLHGFNIPSSLYAFKTKDENFNLNTFIIPESIAIQMNGIILILCIGDGLLCKNYLRGKSLENLNQYLQDNELINANYPTLKVALAEIIALRINIPILPSFIFTNNTMVNLSFNTLNSNPKFLFKVNEDEIAKDREVIFKQLSE